MNFKISLKRCILFISIVCIIKIIHYYVHFEFVLIEEYSKMAVKYNSKAEEIETIKYDILQEGNETQSFNFPPYYVHTYVHSREEVRSTDSEDIRSWIYANKENAHFKRFFWDDNDVRNLIKCHFPEYTKIAHSIPIVCMSDLARYAILYVYGGIYVDTDVKALRPLSELYDFVYNGTDKDTVIIGSEPVPHIMFLYKFIGEISSYRGIPATTVMIAESNNPFFIYAMRLVWLKYESIIQNGQQFPEPWMFTGPLLLRNIVMDLSRSGKFVFTNDLQTTGYSTDENIKFKVIPSETFYPEMASFMGPRAAAMVKNGDTDGIPLNIIEYVKQWYEKYSITGGYTSNTYLVHHWLTVETKSNSKMIPLTEIIDILEIYTPIDKCRE